MASSKKHSKKHRKLMFCSNDVCEKKVHRKKKHTINKDILLTTFSMFVGFMLW